MFFLQCQCKRMKEFFGETEKQRTTWPCVYRASQRRRHCRHAGGLPQRPDARGGGRRGGRARRGRAQGPGRRRRTALGDRSAHCRRYRKRKIHWRFAVWSTVQNKKMCVWNRTGYGKIPPMCFHGLTVTRFPGCSSSELRAALRHAVTDGVPGPVLEAARAQLAVFAARDLAAAQTPEEVACAAVFWNSGSEFRAQFILQSAPRFGKRVMRKAFPEG